MTKAANAATKIRAEDLNFESWVPCSLLAWRFSARIPAEAVVPFKNCRPFQYSFTVALPLRVFTSLVLSPGLRNTTCPLCKPPQVETSSRYESPTAIWTVLPAGQECALIERCRRVHPARKPDQEMKGTIASPFDERSGSQGHLSGTPLHFPAAPRDVALKSGKKCARF